MSSARVDSLRDRESRRNEKGPIDDKAIRRFREPRSGHVLFVLNASLFLSGAAALIYQVLWIRQLSLVVGIEIYSITIAVSAFFAGLAIGGATIGRIADQWPKPLRLYVLLEIGTAITAIISTGVLGHAAPAFVAVHAHAGIFTWSIPFALVGVPAFFMGGTLPVAIRSMSFGFENVAESGGWIYAINTAGGIGGALASSFLLIRNLVYMAQRWLPRA